MSAKTYSLGQRCMAYMLLASLFLQSCSNYTKPYIPKEAQDTRPKIEEIDPLENHNYKGLQIPIRPQGGDNIPIAQKPLNIIKIPQESHQIDGKSFRRQNVSGRAMRCFFNAAGLDVQEQIDKLVACQNDPVVRYMIANEIVSAAENPNQLPSTVKDAIGFTLYESQKQAVDNLEEKRAQVLYVQNPVGNEQNTQALPKVLQNTSKRYEELREELRQKACALKAFKAFVNDHIGGEQMMVALHDVQGDGSGDNNYANYTSIDAIAYINQLGIKIYQPNNLNGVLRLAHQFIPASATKIVYLHHSNFHFQALIPEEPIKELSNIGTMGLQGGMMEDSVKDYEDLKDQRDLLGLALGRFEKKEDEGANKPETKEKNSKQAIQLSLPWHASPSLAARIKEQRAVEGQPLKTCPVLPEDPECNQIVQQFLLQKPHGYGISKITHMYNPLQQQAFEAELVNMELEAKTFLPQWTAEKEPRDHVIKRWEEQTSPFSPLTINTLQGPYTLHAAKVLPLWHGSNASKCSSIAASGFTYFGKHHFFSPHEQEGAIASTDQGFFGSGIYFTNSPRYAAMYSSGEMLLSWVSMREPFPVVSDVPHPKKCADMEMLGGRGAYQNYNAHYIPVAPIYPNNLRCATCYPCYKGQPPAWDEIVVFQKAQTLPCFQVSLAVDSPELPFSQVYSFASCYDACQQGDLVRVQGWIQEDPKRLYEKGHGQESLCQAAVMGNQLKVLQLLHAQDPSLIKERTEEGMNLLHLAASLGYAEIATWLDTQDSQQLTDKNKEGWTPLHLAAFHEQLSVLELFLKRMSSYFMLEIVGKPCPKTLRFLLEKGFDPLMTNSSKQTLLHLAAQAGQEENIRCLLRHQLNINAQDPSGRMPLFLAFLQAHRSMIKPFERGINPFIANFFKQTLLYPPVQPGQKENDLSLLPEKVSINAQDLSGRTPLFLAVLQGYRSVVKLLLEHQARPDLATTEGETALHAAASYGNTPLLADLVPLCPELLHAKDHDGKTPLHKAVWGSPKPDVVQLLLKKGARVDEKNTYGYTALHWVAKHGHFDSAKLLLEKGADLLAVNQNGDTPLDLAIRWGQDAVARLLIDPTLVNKSSYQAPAPAKDPEGFYYQQFEVAYEQSEPLDQILYLEKLGELFLNKQQYIQAAHLFNNALAAAIRYEFETAYQQLLLAKLERIEGLFLEQELKLKTPASHQGYLRSYRHELNCIRQQAQLLLEKGRPIEKVQQEINSCARELFRKIVTSCMELLGQAPPTRFAVLGLGSMGRQEMCPYSDVEFAILIEQETPESMRYFRQLSQLVELRILNMGETAYPLIRPKRIGEVWTEGGSLTPHGFSMDTGGLAPLGKKGVYELIGTPDKIAAYQDPSWLAKNEGEVILVNALAQGSFIIGNSALVETYKKKVNTMLEGKKSFFSFGNKLRQERALALLKGHLEEFGPLLDERRIDLRGFDVKKDLYRPLQMIIGSLALYYGLETTSTLAQIEALAQQGVLSQEGSTRLDEAFKQALYWRFQAHLFYRNEKEIFYHAQDSEDPLAKGLLTFGEKERQQLLEMYRVLVPLHQKVQLFLKDQQKSLPIDNLYDASIGKISLQHEQDLNYREALKIYQQSVALNPVDPEGLNHLQRMSLQLGRAQECLKYNQERLSILKNKHGVHLDKQQEAAACYNEIGMSLRDLGRYQEAMEYLKKALEVSKEVFGEKHSNVATDYNNIGLSLSNLGRHAESLEYHQKALELGKEVLGEKHPNVATDHNNIGVALRNLGRHAEALKYHKKALEIQKEVLREKHPDVATSYNNIGISLQDLGRHAEALEYYKKALETWKEVLGKKHPNVATSYNNIGLSLVELGKYQGGLKYLKKALKIRKEVLREKHPDIAISYNNIGAALSGLKRHMEALEYHKKALEIRKEVLGEKHLDVATSYDNIGGVLRDLGRQGEAMEYYKKALETWKEVLGEKHPNVAISYDNIGISLKDLGKYQLGLEYLKKGLETWKEVLGEKHPDVATSYNNIGGVLRDLGRQGEAMEYYKKALETWKEVLGEKHPNVAISYNNIGMSLVELGKYQVGLEYLKKALEIFKGVLGEKHPLVGKSYNNIGATLKGLGRPEEALEYDKKALAIQKEALGEKHPSVEKYKVSVGKKEKECLLQAIKSNSVGVELYKAKNYTKAIEEYTKAIDLINLLPDSNPDEVKIKATFLFNRARAFDNQEKLDLAIKDYQAVIILNPTHAKASEYLKQCLEK